MEEFRLIFHWSGSLETLYRSSFNDIEWMKVGTYEEMTKYLKQLNMLSSWIILMLQERNKNENGYDKVNI